MSGYAVVSFFNGMGEYSLSCREQLGNTFILNVLVGKE